MLSKLSSPPIENALFNYLAIFKGTGYALISSVCLIAISGTTLYFSPALEEWIPILALGIFFLSALYGGFTAARTAGYKGLFHGLLVGILFLLLTIIVSFFMHAQLLGIPLAKKVTISVLAGLLGGIWGVGNK